MTAATTSASFTLDLRNIPPRDRHPLIFMTFGRLSAGEAMEIVNDHDPKPLHYQFQDVLPGQFDWSYIASGPQLWRVAIRKTHAATRSAPEAEKACCGGCGCA